MDLLAFPSSTLSYNLLLWINNQSEFPFAEIRLVYNIVAVFCVI